MATRAKKAAAAATPAKDPGSARNRANRAPAPVEPPEISDALLSLEAMRLGVVPTSGASAFTVGRDNELRAIEDDLHAASTGHGAVRTVLGDYGTGKTHMLELVRERALDQGYVVAWATLSAQETSPAHPGRVHRALMHGLTYPDRRQAAGEGLGPLLDRAIYAPAAIEAFDLFARDARTAPAHRYLTPALRYWGVLEDPDFVSSRRSVRSAPERSADAVGDARDLLLQWLQGDPHSNTDDANQTLSAVTGLSDKLYALKDYRPWARIWAYVLSGVSTLVRACGYRGLVVLLDEAEFYSLLGSQERAHARTLFKALTWAAIGPREDLPFTEEDLAGGGQGLIRDLPARWRDDAGLLAVFAMTPSPDGDVALQGAVPSDGRMELPHLEAADYRLLVERVLRTCDEARPGKIPLDRLVGPLSDLVVLLQRAGRVQNPRHAMKLVIELMDIAFFRPQDLATAITDLRRVLAGSV